MTRTSPARIVGLVILSVLRFSRLAAARALCLPRDRVGEWHEIEDRGRYMIFAETMRRDTAPEDCAVAVVGFRLRFLGSNALLHRLFMRVCILSTPFWSGFAGFRFKLWMVGEARDYIGLYKWVSERDALTYLSALIPALDAVSVPGSLWYRLEPHQTIEAYLQRSDRRNGLGERFSAVAAVAQEIE